MKHLLRENIDPVEFSEPLRPALSLDPGPSAELCGVHAEGVQAAPMDSTISLIESSLLRCLLSPWRVSILRDVAMEACDCSNAAWHDAAARRVRMRACRCTGLTFAGASLSDVLFDACKLDLACLMEARLQRVWFDACDLREADLDGATLDRVTFRNCDLRGARLLRSPLAAVDLRGSRLDGLAVSPESVRGCLIEPTQADVFAAALGLELASLEPDNARL